MSSTSAEANAAQLALNSAQLQSVTAANSMDAAQNSLINSLFTGNTTYKEQAGLLYQALLLHPQNAAGIALEKQKLDEAKIAADALPGSKTVKFTADTGEAMGQISDLELRAIGLTRETYQIMINVGGDALGYLAPSDRNIKRDIVPVRWT
jgi:hypothetical protein